MRATSIGHRGLWIGVVVALLALAPSTAGAQNPPPDDEGSGGAAAAAKAVKSDDAKPGRVRVVDAYPQDPKPEGRKEIGLADMLVVEVSDLAAFVGAENESCNGVRLVLDGDAFDSPRPYQCNVGESRVLFNLNLIDRESEAWTGLLARRKQVKASVDVSLFLEGTGTLPTDARGKTLLLMNQAYGIWSLIGYGLLVVFFVVLARRTQMLRDSGPKSAVLRPYSLARVQSAWWTLLVLGAFLLISLMVGTAVVIPGSILGLMGIAAGTFVGGELVESSRGSGTATAAGGGGAAAPAAPAAPQASKGFVRDILSDSTGTSFSRFQMAIWTVTLGIFFVIKVYKNLAMPEFDTTLLGLMGISNGTYLGMKTGEGGK